MNLSFFKEIKITLILNLIKINLSVFRLVLIIKLVKIPEFIRVLILYCTRIFIIMLSHMLLQRLLLIISTTQMTLENLMYPFEFILL